MFKCNPPPARERSSGRTGGMTLAILLIALTLGTAAGAHAASASGAAIDFSDPTRLALETDALLDAMPPAPLDTSLRRWTAEILPWFAEEGIANERAPSRVHYVAFHGWRALHVLGATDCARGVVSINARYVNPVSTMYRSPDLLFTLTHELAHVQQNDRCDLAPVEDVETSAQLVALEVDAAIALSGNIAVSRALLTELRSLAVGVLKYEALNAVPGAVEQLDTVVTEIYTPAEQLAQLQLARSWASDPVGRLEALYDYDVLPYEKLATALRGDKRIDGLTMPINVARPWDPTATTGTLNLDELAIFLDHAGDLSVQSPD